MTKQGQAKLWLNLIYPENKNTNINPIYLQEYTAHEVLESFSHFRRFMMELFYGIAEREIDFSAPLQAIFAVISAMVNSGRLDGDILAVNKKTFKEKLKKPQKADKDAVIGLLKDNGFIFDSNLFSVKDERCTVEFPDDNLVLKGMYLYSATYEYKSNQGMMYYSYQEHMYILLNPRLFENTYDNEITFIADDFFRLFGGSDEKEAINIFHERLLDIGCDFHFKADIFGAGFGKYEYALALMCYYINNRPTAFISVRFDDSICRKPSIGVKISEMRTNTRKYNEFIENCSDEFKHGLNSLPFFACSLDNCGEKGFEYKEPCKHCMEYTLNGVHYRKCTRVCWGCVEDRHVFAANKNDIDTYLFFVRENLTKRKRL